VSPNGWFGRSDLPHPSKAVHVAASNLIGRQLGEGGVVVVVVG